MNKTITMYELLGLVKDGKAPKKIKYNGGIYTYQEQKGNKIYQYEDYNAVLNIQCFEQLNDEVEILEEEKKIPEKLEERYYHDEPALIDDMAHKINEIIDYLDYLNSKGDE